MNTKTEQKALNLTSFQSLDFWALATVTLYCLIYAAIRLNVSNTLDWDETEQYINSDIFMLGNAKQPPLYSWIVFALNSVFGKSPQLIMGLRYIFLFIFYTGIYFSARMFWDAKKSILVLASTVFFLTYSTTINSNLTHTVLLAAVSVLSFLVFLKLLNNKSAWNYLFLGLCFGFGAISKYNFVFLLFPLMLVGISLKATREIVFNRKFLITMVTSLIIVVPHLVWLYQDGFTPLVYAMNRGDSGELKVFNIFSIIKSFSHYSFQVLIFSSVALLFFGSALNFQIKTTHYKVMRLIAAYAFLLPLLVIVALRLASFTLGWLTPVYFLLPFAFFSFLDMEKISSFRYKAYLLICALITLVIMAFNFASNFAPDLRGKVMMEQEPYKILAPMILEQLQANNSESLKDILFLTPDAMILSNLKIQIPAINIVLCDKENRNFKSSEQRGEPLYFDEGGLAGYKQKVFLWTASKRKNRDIPKRIRKLIGSSSYTTDYLEANYINSKKLEPYVLGLIKAQ